MTKAKIGEPTWLSALHRIASISSWNPDATRHHEKIVRSHSASLLRLKRLAEQSEEQRAHRYQLRILKSYAGRVCATLEEIAHRPGLAKVEPVPLAAFEKFARSVQPLRRSFGTARVIAQIKANGTRRIVMSPDQRIRASQRLVGHVLDCWVRESECEYNRRGRGREAAVSQVKQMIEAGARCFIQFDVENFFSSVKPNHLHGKIPIPAQAIKHTVFFNSDAVLIGIHLSEAEAEAARQRLPAGARLSGTVAAMLLGRELRKTCGGTGLVTYVDDGVIGGCDPAGAKALAKTLQSQFSNIPGGPLSFKYLRVVSAEEGFSFLGYWIRLVEKDDARVVVRPSHEAKTKLKRALFRRLRPLGKEPTWPELEERAMRYSERWMRSFSLWQPSDTERGDIRDLIFSYVGDFVSGYSGKPGMPKVCLHTQNKQCM